MRRAIFCLAAMTSVVIMPAVSAGAMPAHPTALPSEVCSLAGTAESTLGSSPLAGILAEVGDLLSPLLGGLGLTEGLCS